MKCVTICQPWAWCILRAGKRVENRTWPTAHRGPVLIHAGLSLEWLGTAGRELGERGMREPARRDMVFGAIVGTARIVACCERLDALDRFPDQRLWISGPYCWVLEDVREFARPIRYRGAQGLFEVPDSVIADAGRGVVVGDGGAQPAEAVLGFDQAVAGGDPTAVHEFTPRARTGNLFT